MRDNSGLHTRHACKHARTESLYHMIKRVTPGVTVGCMGLQLEAQPDIMTPIKHH